MLLLLPLCALAQEDAYFLSNVIASQSLIYHKDAIYDRICNHCKQDFQSNSSEWIQLQYTDSALEGDSQSIGKFSDKKKGLLLGWDRFFYDENLVLGIAGNLLNSRLRQGSSRGDVLAYGFGLYGGYIKEKWDVKFMLGFNWNNYEVSRYDEIRHRTSKSFFSGFTNSIDAEIAYKYYLGKEITFRPFFGGNFAFVKTPDVSEISPLTEHIAANSNTFKRSGMRLGLGFEDTDGKLLWNAYMSAEAVLEGKRLELQGSFENQPGVQTFSGASIGSMVYTLGGGAAYTIGKTWQVYINGFYKTSSNYFSAYGNAGFRYLFCLPMKKIERFEDGSGRG